MGIPILVFYTFLIVTMFAFISGLFLWVLIIGCCCLRPSKIWAGLSKLSLALLMFIFLFFPNPLLWPAQIANHIDTARVITPTHPLVQQLNTTSAMWVYLNETYGVTPAYFFNNMTDDERLENMTDYIITEIVAYEEVMGHYFVLDYLPTAPEAILEGRGDCKARTAVMVSFFLFMGYDAWGVEDCFHTYTCVFLGPNRTNPHYYYTRGRTDYMIMFNNESIIYTKDIIQRLGYILFNEKFSKEIQDMFAAPTTLFILPGIFIGMGFLIPLIIQSTNWDATHKKYLKNAALCAIILIGGFGLALGIGSLVPQAILSSIAVSAILSVQLVHSNCGDIIFHLITKNKPRKD